MGNKTKQTIQEFLDIPFHITFLSPNMDLYLKAGPSGSDLGDCPFAHFVRMVIAVKGKSADCNVKPCVQDTKPEWLVKDLGGKMPCLDHSGKRTIESGDIAIYLDETFPEPPLRFADAEKEAEASTAIVGVFPALAKLNKNKDKASEEDLKDGLWKELKKIDHYLDEKCTADFLLGDKISLLDCSLAPKLYLLKVTLMAFNPELAMKLPSELWYLDAYMTRMFAHPAFNEAKYPEETVVWGWENARKNA